MPLDIEYFTLGHDKRLCDIVFAGSHDAGINEGDSNVMTQKLNIYDQATAGVRLFDLRITGNRQGPNAPVTLQAYHAALPTHSNLKGKHVTDLDGETRKVTVSALNGGGFGLGLTQMLLEARRFVEDNTNEFVILKFDKCKNWEIIADACILHLGNKIKKGLGSLNEKTLTDLAGKVIVVFKHKNLSSLINPATRRAYNSVDDGIFGCRSLDSGDSLEQLESSLQYVGKGGTSATNGKSDIGKIAENIHTQKIKVNARDMAGRDPKVMGMIYWTTTGFKRSIRERNKAMWDVFGQQMLQNLWVDCLQDSITRRVGDRWDFRDYSHGGTIKTYMPNIVMIDFANLRKCTFIRSLNDVAATQFTQAVRNV